MQVELWRQAGQRGVIPRLWQKGTTVNTPRRSLSHIRSYFFWALFTWAYVSQDRIGSTTVTKRLSIKGLAVCYCNRLHEWLSDRSYFKLCGFVRSTQAFVLENIKDSCLSP